MNCPSRTDPEVPDGWNQSPNALDADSTTRSDLGKVASARILHDYRLKSEGAASVELRTVAAASDPDPNGRRSSIARLSVGGGEHVLQDADGTRRDPRPPGTPCPRLLQPLDRAQRAVWRYIKFVGPGFMIAVAYIDPGNYATDAAAGATYRFKLLFMVLLSNIFAIFLQSLCIRMSTVTGLNLAEMNKAHCPRWLNYLLFFFGEAAVIATDIAEVIGFAIALNILAPKLPVVAGCAISILDVMFILLFYQPEGSIRGLRIFECFVMLLVLGVVVCFCYQLSLIKGTTPREVFQGYLPSSAIVQGQGLYQACGILGATVMPHSLYLGSGLVQPRLKEFDKKHNTYGTSTITNDDEDAHTTEQKYRPSMAAIKGCMKYSIIELATSLFTFALFVNSAILIVCGASLYSVNGAQDADLFGIYNLLHQQIGHAAATVFAVALLLSGCSAGIVCTMAGQIISEGQLHWKLKPWITRLLTRSISIVPAILVAGTIGERGLSAALVGSQVTLSVILPFVTAPLIYYTCRNKYMWVCSDVMERNVDGEERPLPRIVYMKNHWLVMILAILIWLIIVIMNVANIVLTGRGVKLSMRIEHHSTPAHFNRGSSCHPASLSLGC